jgi:predicted MFS family arabinose efflux permease
VIVPLSAFRESLERGSPIVSKPEVEPPARTVESRTRPSPFGAFRHQTFTVIWLATVVSNLGSWVSTAASGWLMTSLNHDPLIVSLVQVAGNFPIFCLALPAGALVDVVNRRRFLIVGEIVTMAAGIAFAVLVSAHVITPRSLILMTALTSAAAAICAPAWQAVVSQLVPRSDLPGAVALNSLGVNISRAVGPALGGFLVSTLGFAPPFWIDAFSNAGVIGALFWWRLPTARGSGLPPERFGGAILTGLRHARYNPHLSATLVRTAGFFFFASAYWALLPVVTRVQVTGGPALYGTLLGAIGAGAIGGAFALPRLKELLGADRLMAWCTVGTALATALFALSHNAGTSLLASVLAGACWIGAVSSLNLSAQVALPEWVRGRGLAVFVTVMFGALTLGGLLWGNLASALGTSGSLLIAAAGTALAVPLTWRWKLQTGAGIDFTPSQHWPMPITTHEIEQDRGPVLVTVEYRIDPKNRAEFLAALRRYSRERRRDGAFLWRVFEDPAQEGRFLEIFMADSWLEHLRQHARVTRSDRRHEEALRRFQIDGSPTTTHFIEVSRDPD